MYWAFKRACLCRNDGDDMIIRLREYCEDLIVTVHGSALATGLVLKDNFVLSSNTYMANGIANTKVITHHKREIKAEVIHVFEKWGLSILETEVPACVQQTLFRKEVGDKDRFLFRFQAYGLERPIIYRMEVVRDEKFTVEKQEQQPLFHGSPIFNENGALVGISVVRFNGKYVLAVPYIDLLKEIYKLGKGLI